MLTIKSIKPLFDGVVTTANKYAYDENSVIATPKEYMGFTNDIQTVLFVGELASKMGLKNGDIVRLNFNRYLTVRHEDGPIENGVQKDNMKLEPDVPKIYIEGYGECLYIHTNDIVYIVDDYDVDGGGLLQTGNDKY